MTAHTARESWHGFLETYEPLRSELYRYCRYADGVEAVRAVTFLEPDGDRIARMVNHFYDPDFLTDVAGELGIPVRVNGYRWWLKEGQGICEL